MARRRRLHPARHYGGYWHKPWYPSYEPSRPRAVKDGIKARSQRGKIGETWWSDRWIAVLESFDMGARLHRGRAYARRGQVMSIHIEPGGVKAKVQGSRPQPYSVTIKLKPLSDREWKKATDVMAGQAIFAAKLLAGEMPRDIEDAFRTARLSLFPARGRDLDTECSCPDWANPCKHIAAVYYLLAEEFDRDPFMLFALRGRTKAQIIETLRAKRVASGGVRAAPKTRRDALPGSKAAHEASSEEEAHSLDGDLGSFWSCGKGMEEFRPLLAPPEVACAILKRLGPAPFEGPGENPAGSLARAYAVVSRYALELGLEAGETKFSHQV
jgi:uncharacterized Zn finger protein